LKATKDNAVMTQAGRVYLDQSEDIDLSTVPRDFANAFERYRTSWRSFATALELHPHDTKDAAADIDRHWETVLAGARRYGAVK
jgi:hypothetical protein